VIIQDKNVVPIQKTEHRATMEGFFHKPVPYRLNNAVWDVVFLNPILVIDNDKDGNEGRFDKIPREPQPQLPPPNHYRVREVSNRQRYEQ
jgi:hypothetical protein